MVENQFVNVRIPRIRVLKLQAPGSRQPWHL